MTDPTPDGIDPDVDLNSPAQRAEIGSSHGRVLPVVAAGGVIGAVLRFQIGLWWPTPVGGFPYATMVVNLLGCLVIGGFMVLVTERMHAHPLVRPFVGTGILGGFTTFSTYTVDIHTLLVGGHPVAALSYLAATAAGAVAAVSAGIFLGRRLFRGQPTGSAGATAR